MSGGAHGYVHEHTTTLEALAAREDTLQEVAGRLLQLGADQAARDTLDLARDLRQWGTSAVQRAGALADVWATLDRADAGDTGEEAVRKAAALYAASELPPARRAVEDPAGYLRAALDRHERQEHARRTLHPHAPDLYLSSGDGSWTTEDRQELTPEWWERHSDPGADPFTLALITTMRSVLDDHDAEARVLEAGHRTGWTEGGQAVRARLIREWAQAYAAREEA